MNPSSLDIVELMENDSALPFERAVDMFTNRMPSTPQTLVSVYDNAGESPMLTLQKNTSNYFYPEISVWVRDITYELAYNKALVIMERLHGTHGVVLNSTYYALISAKADPALLHYDENDRAVIVVNFAIQRRQDNTP